MLSTFTTFNKLFNILCLNNNKSAALKLEAVPKITAGFLFKTGVASQRIRIQEKKINTYFYSSTIKIFSSL
jgi:hypothetical protein